MDWTRKTSGRGTMYRVEVKWIGERTVTVQTVEGQSQETFDI